MSMYRKRLAYKARDYAVREACRAELVGQLVGI